MSLYRIMVPAAMIGLVFASGSFAQNRQHRRAVRADRPYQSAAINPYMASVGYRGTATTGDVQTLAQAYKTLESADHDYQGHRVKAMEAIKKAARLIGQRFGTVAGTGAGTGVGKVKEQQTLSDSQLRRAVQQSLQQVRTTVGGRKQQLAVSHINEAIRRLDVALSIK